MPPDDTSPAATVDAALRAAAESHFEAVIEARVEDIIDRYAASADTYVFVEGPRWSTTGHEAIADGWRAYVDAPLSVQSIEWIEEPRGQRWGDQGWLGGIVELTVEAPSGVRPVRFRGTYVMERGADDTWRIVHEHFSQPADDPYGTGDWL
jgi:ketosteroid isomerase-like protein